MKQNELTKKEQAALTVCCSGRARAWTPESISYRKYYNRMYMDHKISVVSY